MDAEHPLHDRLAAFASAGMGHDPMCIARPCARGVVVRVVTAVVREHHPLPSRSINSLACEKHHPLKSRPDLDEVEKCPACVVTPIIVCSCWDCSGYPCPTVEAVAEALQIR
jgi:hypothetical protein